MINDTVAIVLGAGKGTRMKSDLPKVLHCINGIPMIIRVEDTVRKAGIEKIFVVVGYKSDMVRKILSKSNVEFIEQNEQLGTAHAVLQGESKLRDHKGDILVINGDSPMVRVETIKRLLEKHKSNGSAATILTCFMDNADGYGRILRTNNSYINGIIEDKEASEEEKKIKEINVGVYCFNNNYLFPALKEVKMDNKKGEMYLTDIIRIFISKKLKVIGVSTDNSDEVIGVDTKEKLIKAEEMLKRVQHDI